MVSATPERIEQDARALFYQSDLPESLLFYSRLTPAHQRRFSVELWEALSRRAISRSDRELAELVELVEAWEATAEVEAAPEVVDALRNPRRTGELALD